MSTIALTLLIISIVSALGWALGSIKYRNISLGVSGVLFIGLIVGHLLSLQAVPTNRVLLEFIRDFGLILFVYSIGMQMGRGFWANLIRQGKELNFLSFLTVFFGSVLIIILYKLTDIPLDALLGIYSGAVTNTPTLGAGQEILESYYHSGGDTAGLGYAVTYPFGVIGVMFVIILLKWILKISLKEEVSSYELSKATDSDKIEEIELEITNPYCNDLALGAIPGMFKQGVVTTFIDRGEEEFVPNLKTKVFTGDILHLVGPSVYLKEMKIVLGGGNVSLSGIKVQNKNVKTEKILVTNYKILGKSIHEAFDNPDSQVIISRVKRSGHEVPAEPGTKLCFGDILTVTGKSSDILSVVQLAGNDPIAMDKIRVAPIFIGLSIGILFGMIPFAIPGLSLPVKLGIAGGPLLLAIYFAGLGNFGQLIWYLPPAANNLLRELGITLFLAVVGIIAGSHFLDILLSGSGVKWLFYGVLITGLPILLTGLIARFIFKINFLTISGTLCASMTNPTALAFSTAISSSEAPIVAYITTYPLTVVLRIISIQVIFLLLV